MTDDRTYLYRFYGDGFTLLYIGITSGLVDRFEAHMKGKDWWQDVRHIDIARYDTRALALEAEAKAIRDEGPAYNVQHGTASPKPHAKVFTRGSGLTSPADLRYILRAWNVSISAGADVFGVTRQAATKWLKAGIPAARIGEVQDLAEITEQLCAASPTPLAVLIRRPLTRDGSTLLSLMRESGDPRRAIALLATLRVDAA